MSTRLTLLAPILPPRLGSAYFCSILFWTTVVWLQSTGSSASPIPNSPVSKPTKQSSVLQLDQLEKPSIKATDLLRTCDDDLSEVSDIKVKSSCQDQTKKIAQTNSSGEKEDGNSGILQPTKDRFLIDFGERDPYSFNWGLGSLIGEPTALQGGTRLKASPTVGQIITVFPVGGYFEKGFGPNHRALVEIIGDPQGVVLDLSYTIAPQSMPGAFSFNAQTTRSWVGAFSSEGANVKLPRGADPWLHRTGGGVEYLVPLSSQFKLASAFNYQLVSVRPGAFTDRIRSVDEEGNKVTVSDGGQDTLVTFNLAGILNAIDDLAFPTKGTKLKFGIEASIPTGDANISFGRFTGNATQYIPLNIFGFTKGPRTLVVNFQAGTFAGDVPPYEAFSMGGSNTVRGYRNGEVGTGSSFIMTSAEYRFPIANDLNILVDFDLQGTLFVDYGTDLGTADKVIGEPANVRNKKGSGLGYGVGLNLKTDFGLIRTEFAWSEDGDFITHFTVGDRF